jgi:hypothetical protein
MTYPPRGLIRAGCASALALAVLGGPAIASAAPTAQHSPVPTGFRANSITWLNARLGWVLGTERCGDAPAQDNNCPGSQVVGTTDGGKSWHLVGSLSQSIPLQGFRGKGVTEIRFATARVGWAFAPGLARTDDGGRTWTPQTIPGNGKQVLDMAITQSAAFAIVSPCGYAAGLCHGKPLSAWRIGKAGTKWKRMPLKLHANVSADIAAYGRTVYVVNPMVDGPLGTQFFASTDGGARFSPRRDPCGRAEEHELIQATPYSATKVGLLCDGDPGLSKAVKAVYLSANTGRTAKFAGIMNLIGIQAELAISPAGNLAVATWSDGSFIDVNLSHGGTKWKMPIASGDGGAGFNDITYTGANTAWVVGSPVDMPIGIGALIRTTSNFRHYHCSLVSGASC